MQVASNTTPDKQAGLERQVQSKERQTAINNKTSAIISEEKATAAKGAERNETSQYLKVLSRIENLLIQDKLPEAAVEGFVGAIKKQIDLINEADRQMLLKLPEVTKLDLKNLDDLPEMIKNNLRNESKLPALLKVLRQPKFAVLMRTDGKPAPKTYTAQSTQLPTPAKSPTPKLTGGPPNKEKPVLDASPKVVQNASDKKSTHATNPAA
tara:strand:+ start:13 stop:642 length:630 start_codon:yes stop_codon:yes gene_type:complete